MSLNRGGSVGGIVLSNSSFGSPLHSPLGSPSANHTAKVSSRQRSGGTSNVNITVEAEQPAAVTMPGIVPETEEGKDMKPSTDGDENGGGFTSAVATAQKSDSHTAAPTQQHVWKLFAHYGFELAVGNLADVQLPGRAHTWCLCEVLESTDTELHVREIC
jgi:hypothetical protein